MRIPCEGRHSKKAGGSCFLRPLLIVAAGDRRDADEEKDGCGCRPFNLYFNVLVMSKDGIGDEGE